MKIRNPEVLARLEELRQNRCPNGTLDDVLSLLLIDSSLLEEVMRLHAAHQNGDGCDPVMYPHPTAPNKRIVFDFGDHPPTALEIEAGADGKLWAAPLDLSEPRRSTRPSCMLPERPAGWPLGVPDAADPRDGRRTDEPFFDDPAPARGRGTPPGWASLPGD